MHLFRPFLERSHEKGGESMKKFLRRFSFGILAAAMGISMLNLPVVVEAAGEQTEYKIYPTPHEVVYGDSLIPQCSLRKMPSTSIR